MNFIFSKRTRRIVTNILSKSVNDTQANEKQEARRLEATAALSEEYEAKRTLPILSFNEDGDIDDTHKKKCMDKCDRMMWVADRCGHRYDVKFPTKGMNLDRRGVVIQSSGYTKDGQMLTQADKSSLIGSELSIVNRSACTNLKKTLKNLIFSQIGVGCLVILYVILGGLMFDAIESSNEREVKARQKLNRDNLISRLRFAANEMFNNDLNTSFEMKYSHWRDCVRRRKWVDRDQWSVTLNEQRWNDIVMSELALYEHRELETGYKDTKDQEEKQNEVWTVTSAMLYSATVITTIGYGNITPKTTHGKILTMIYALFGIPLMFICLTNTGDVLANIFINAYSKAINSFCFTCCSERFRRIAGYSNDDVSGIDDEVMNRDNSHSVHHSKERKHVPILATIAALAIYIFSGAVLFGSWEEWQVIDGAYFCFITFTTIGFGDFVPGQGSMSRNKSGKMLLCAIFLLVGMIVMAMCFKLMQDEITVKIRAIGKRLGCIDLRLQLLN